MSVMGLIILCTIAQRDGGSPLQAGLTDALSVAVVEDLPLQLAPGRWTILRRDRWLFDQQTVDMLRALGAGPGVELADPTGLLGGSRYGFDIGREPAPIVQRSLRGRRPAGAPQEPKTTPREVRRAFS